MLYSAATMNKNTEVIKTLQTAPRWIPKWGIAAFIAAIISRHWLSRHVDADVTLRAVVALAPVPVWFMWARSCAQGIRLLDEMKQLITYKAWFFAGLGTMFVMMALRQVQLVGFHLPEWFDQNLNCENTFILMAFLVVVGFIWSNRRYK
jgi:hypothetical protein